MTAEGATFKHMKLDDAWLKAPQTHPAPGFEKPGVKALFYDGVPFQGKPTRVFAYYGVPQVEPGKKVPAIVLIHGGGSGTAFESWVELWNKRGYAAIAMDTCGAAPKFSNNVIRHEFSGPAGWGDFDGTAKAPQDQWTYHAVSAAILGHSLLRSMPEVDADRIGVTGISWGGCLTCIVSSLDTRFKFAAPVYGCGFLGDNSCWLQDFEKIGKANTSKWLKWWDPSAYLKNNKLPMLWVNGTNDFAFPMDSYQKSYRQPKGERTLCIKVRMPHGHGGLGENPPEILAFANSIVRNDIPLAKVASQERKNRDVAVGFTSRVPIVKAELNYTAASGKWQDRIWETIPASLSPGAKKAIATLPEGVSVYYFNIIDDRGLYVSSEHVEVEKP